MIKPTESVLVYGKVFCIPKMIAILREKSRKTKQIQYEVQEIVLFFNDPWNIEKYVIFQSILVLDQMPW